MMGVEASSDQMKRLEDASGIDYRRISEFAMKIVARVIVSISLLWPTASYAIDFNDPSTPIVANGSDVRRIISGTALTGINSFGNPYVYTYHSNGALSGIAGKLNQYDDRGRWSVEGNKLCTHWEIWVDGKKICYTVAVGGGRVRFLGDNGFIFQDSVIKGR